MLGCDDTALQLCTKHSQIKSMQGESWVGNAIKVHAIKNRLVTKKYRFEIYYLLYTQKSTKRTLIKRRNQDILFF